MKVILLRDVAKLGRRHSIIEVPDGFALNKLIPQKMAAPATPENVKKVQARADHVEHAIVEKNDSFKNTLTALQGVVITVPVDANAQGHLFKAVKPADVVTALRAAGHVVELDMVKSQPIKEIGMHQIPLEHGSLKGEVTISIIQK